MVEVFKTNIRKIRQAEKIIEKLKFIFPDYKINFDLEDCDKILRIESEIIDSPKVIQLLNDSNFQCEILV
jgi:hypothetical protein